MTPSVHSAGSGAPIRGGKDGRKDSMDEYAVDILPGAVLRWARADAAQTAPQFWIQASKQYTAETDFDREDHGIGESEAEDLTVVSIHGLLELSPRHGPGGWTLQLRADDDVGLIPGGEEGGYEDEGDMPIDAFEEQFLLPEKGEVEVVVQAEDDAAWGRFQDWLAGVRKT